MVAEGQEVMLLEAEHLVTAVRPVLVLSLSLGHPRVQPRVVN